MKKLIFFSLLAFLTTSSYAAVTTLRVQGRVTNSRGMPIPPSSPGEGVTLHFGFFNHETLGTTPLFSASKSNVPTNESGLFAADIEVNPNDFAQYDNLYVEISVQSHGVLQKMQPRQKLSAVPYSMRAEFSVIAGTAAFVGTNAVTTFAIKDGEVKQNDLDTGAVNSLKIEDRSITLIDLSTTTITSLTSIGRDTIVSTNIVNGEVRGEDIAPDAIGPSHIQNNAVSSNTIAVDAVRKIHIATGSITNDHIIEMEVKKLVGQIVSAQIESLDMQKIYNFTGAIVAYGGKIAPPGWLVCDGAQVSRAEYSKLYEIIGNAFGEGDGSSTFHLPDLRGRFLRGVSGTTNFDPDKNQRLPMAPGGNAGNDVMASMIPNILTRYGEISITAQ
jgi:hypothetical protein